MKKIIITSVLVVGLAAGLAYAHGNGYGNHMMGNGYGMMGGNMMGNGYGMMGGSGGGGNYIDCPGTTALGQDSWNNDSHQKFLEETVDLRKEMNEKRFDFMEVQRNPNNTREQVAQLEKEMIDLRTKLSEKAEQYR